MEYDSGDDGGDGNVTEQTGHIDASTTRVTSHSYDWRNRRTDTDGDACERNSQSADAMSGCRQIAELPTWTVLQAQLLLTRPCLCQGLSAELDAIRYFLYCVGALRNFVF